MAHSFLQEAISAKTPKNEIQNLSFLCHIIKDHTLEALLKQVLTNGELIMYLKSAPLPWQSATSQKSPKTSFNIFMLKCTLIITIDIHSLVISKFRLLVSYISEEKSQLCILQQKGFFKVITSGDLKGFKKLYLSNFRQFLTVWDRYSEIRLDVLHFCRYGFTRPQLPPRALFKG